MNVAVVTIAAGRHEHLRLQLAALRRSTRLPDQHVVVAMDDPEIASLCPAGTTVLTEHRPAGRLPLAAARNAGARQAIQRGAEVLIFLDVDCVPVPGLVARYSAVAAERPDALLSGPVTYLPPPTGGGYDLDNLPSGGAHPGRPVPAPDEVRAIDHTLFWSLSFALHATAWARIGGFHTGYSGYGGEDTDFAELARARGIRHLAVGGAWAAHQWHPSPDPPLRHVDDILRNGRVFRERWGWWPMTDWLAGFAELGLVAHDPRTDDWARADGTVSGATHPSLTAVGCSRPAGPRPCRCPRG